MHSTVILDGFLGKSAESKQTENGKLLARFSMSVKCWGKENPFWITVQGWEKTAEMMRDLTTGSRVVVWGRFDYWLSNDNRQIPIIVADRVVHIPKDAPQAKGAAEEAGWG